MPKASLYTRLNDVGYKIQKTGRYRKTDEMITIPGARGYRDCVKGGITECIRMKKRQNVIKMRTRFASLNLLVLLFRVIVSF